MTWVFSFRVDPPTWVVSARDGGNVFFAAYSKALQQWYWVYPGGEKIIDAPQMIFVSEEYAAAHKREEIGRRPTIKLNRKEKFIQPTLNL